MERSMLDDFLNGFDDSLYPDELLQKYEQIECLSAKPEGETLLVRDRHTGEYCIVKCYADPSLQSNISESELLRGLNHEGIPSFAGEYHNGNMLCVVREYAKGVPLDRLVKEKCLSEQQIISICSQLCDILIYLHSQTPPVIHRDIKPQNIIMDTKGRIRLIDFGISRLYDKSATSDTVFFGTQEFAPPEQYGFSQTDNRSDIFSLGVLICWLLIGETDIVHAPERIRNRRLYRVVKKCTAFAPDDRYPNASRVKDAIMGKNVRLLTGAALGSVAMVAIIIVMMFLGGLLNTGRAEDMAKQAVFEEPLIEQALRLALAKDEGEEIIQEDLLSVNELYVFGDKAAGNEEEYNLYSDQFVANDGSVSRGEISSLADLTKLPNLKTLCLAFQNISDLTPLSQCRYLEYIEMRHNPLEDVSPLSGLPSLKMLLIYDTNVSSLTVLAACHRLAFVDVGNTLISSTSALDGLGALEMLSCNEAPLDDLENIETHSMLKQIFIAQTGIIDLSPLLKLPRLEIVEVSEDMKDLAEAIAGEAEFEISYCQ